MSAAKQGIRIAILVEGGTEKMFKNKLNEFLRPRLPGKMPNLIFSVYDGRIPKNEKLKDIVEKLLESNRGLSKVDHVIALTDVYTGTPPDFTSADDAKKKMWNSVGVGNKRFHPHVALHDFEAWLLPFWPTIQKLAGSNKSSPGVDPEQVNHNKPPAKHIEETFLTGSKGKKYKKPVDGERILRDNNLLIAADACPELKAFLNTILRLCDGEPL